MLKRWWCLLNDLEKRELISLLSDIKDNSNITEKQYLNHAPEFDSVEIPEGNKEILVKARDLYESICLLDDNKTFEMISVVDFYRDSVMALILKNYEKSTRERGQIIKNLHKYNTCSEIIEFLFSALCKDAIREENVHHSVQKAVHSYEFVHYYYNKLWSKTERMLEDLNMPKGESELNPVEVYKRIYLNAIKCFLMKPE